jgi:hypothetical protein
MRSFCTLQRARGVLLLAALAAGCSAGHTNDAESPYDGDAADANVNADANANANADANANDDGGDRDGWLQDHHIGDAAHADASISEGGADGDDASESDAHREAAAWEAAAWQDAAVDCSGDGGDPPQLACTGLYSDWASRTIAPGVRPYAPAFPLWSDGADKARYIELPPGTQIDTSDMDQWSFPVGTKLWKQFSIDGQPIETRFLWKRADGDWLRTTYAWTPDGSSASELTAGLRDWNGTSYEIPPQWACQDCHAGRLDNVLGFEAVNLAAPGATGLTLAELVREGLLTNPPATPIVVPGNATESAALAWLHSNCGISCHNRTSWACGTTLFMRLEVASMATVQATDTWNTAVGQPLELLNDGFVPPRPMLRITPGDPSSSAIPYRASMRDVDPSQPNQMPPIDTHVVPDAGIAVINAWIQSMPPGARP